MQYKDSDVSHDHTYYGMGCPNGWGSDGSTGSDIPCVATGRIVKDGNNEDQKNGTYYHYQAATVGTGGLIATNNANVPDTFCPLGWQLPYSGTDGIYYNQSKSWQYLFDNYNIGYGGVYPTSYIFAGSYRWNTGRLYNQDNGGNYWSSNPASSSNAYRLNIWSSGMNPAHSDAKVGGYPIRCATRKRVFHRRHRRQCLYYG